nr:Chain P, residue synthetic peptide [synthetic construct]
IQQSIERI